MSCLKHASLLNRLLMRAKKQPPTISVEGNIAAGKTEFLLALQHQIQQTHGSKYVNLLLEPVKEWNNVRGEKLFDMMMENPKRWAFTFQNYVQLSMYNNHRQTATTPTDAASSIDTSLPARINLIERSIHSARYVFVEHHMRSGNLTNVEYNVLDEFYTYLTKRLNNQLCNVDYFVYLKADPQVCMKRLASRLTTQDQSLSREEARLTLNYLCSLDELHESVFLSRDEFKSKVICIDANQSKKQVVKAVIG